MKTKNVFFVRACVTPTLALSLTVLIAACATPPPPVKKIETQQLSVAAAQRLKNGMKGSEVVDALGAPNIVTSAQDGGETWIYDKISKEISSEKTLVITVTFDAEKKVQKVTYRQSSF